MADVPGESSQPEGNFDNDFEKLDPFAPDSNLLGSGDSEEVTSSSQIQPDMPEEDLYRTTPPNPSEAEPLVDFGEHVTVISQPYNDPEDLPEASSQPVSSSTPESEKADPDPQPTPASSTKVSIKSKTGEKLRIDLRS